MEERKPELSMQKFDLTWNVSLTSTTTTLYTFLPFGTCRVSAPGKNQSKTRAGSSQRVPAVVVVVGRDENSVFLALQTRMHVSV